MGSKGLTSLRAFGAAGLMSFASACGTQVVPPATVSAFAPQPGLAAEALTSFVGAFGSHSPASLTPGEKVAVENAAAIGIVDISARYIDAATAAGADGSWTGDVILSWRVTGERAAEEQIGVTFAQQGRVVTITGFGTPGKPVPLWLLTPVTVSRQGPVTVISAGKDSKNYLAEGLTAIEQVRHTIAWPDAHLTLEVPASEAGLEQVAGGAPGSYKGVAAYTGPVDGRTDGPVHIFINPDSIGSGRDAQIVLTHEAVHAATNAATNVHFTSWVREGFADYVALRAQNLPLSVTADRALATIRKSGPPTTLPTDADFNSAAEDFGEEYQFAWLVWRYLGTLRGPEANVTFYDAVGAGTSVDAALQATWGISETTLTTRWQDYLRTLAK